MKKAILFGAGMGGITLPAMLKGIEVLGYVDNDKKLWGGGGLMDCQYIPRMICHH